MNDFSSSQSIIMEEDEENETSSKPDTPHNGNQVEKTGRSDPNIMISIRNEQSFNMLIEDQQSEMYYEGEDES